MQATLGGVDNEGMGWLQRFEKKARTDSERMVGPAQVIYSFTDRYPKRLAQKTPVVLGIFASHGYRVVSQNQIYEDPRGLATYRATLVFERTGQGGCSSCGSWLEPQAKFCTVCGARV